MANIRSAPSGGFTMISNVPLNDESLGPDELALLVYVRSKPADWKIIPAQLAKRFSFGKNKVYQVLANLMTAGYVIRQRQRYEGGQWGEVEYVVHDEPCSAPLPGNEEVADDPDFPAEIQPLPGFRERANRDPVNSDALLRTDSNKKLKESSLKPRKGGKVEYSEEFENLVWQPYPRKNGTSKKNASRNYERLSADDQALVRAAIPLYAQMVRGKDEQHMKHLEFFISGRVFETIQPPARSGPPRRGDARPEISRDTWEKLLRIYKSTNNWKREWGPPPGHPGCMVPSDLAIAILGTSAV